MISKFRTYAAMAFAAAVLAIAAASPAAAACTDWGYSGVYTHGWPYAATGVSNPPVYLYRSCGGTYNIAGWGECNGYGRCGWEPFSPPVVTVPVTDMAPTSPGERMAAAQAAAGQPAAQPVITRAIKKKRRRAAPADTPPPG